jgi:hypothetical protein
LGDDIMPIAERSIMATDDDFLFEPIEEGPDKEANERKLQQQLKDYQNALEAEFKLDSDYQEGELSPVEVKKRTESLLLQAVPKAVARMKHIVEHSTNDGLALKASQYILDRAIGKDGGKIADPLAGLLEDLRANDPVDKT